MVTPLPGSGLLRSWVLGRTCLVLPIPAHPSLGQIWLWTFYYHHRGDRLTESALWAPETGSELTSQGRLPAGRTPGHPCRESHDLGVLGCTGEVMAITRPKPEARSEGKGGRVVEASKEKCLRVPSASCPWISSLVSSKGETGMRHGRSGRFGGLKTRVSFCASDPTRGFPDLSPGLLGGRGRPNLPHRDGQHLGGQSFLPHPLSVVGSIDGRKDQERVRKHEDG